ncbi:MAG: phosphofructokinase domain-containing protein, partial [Olpidium bornovanus]
MELRDPEFASTYEANQAMNMMENQEIPGHMVGRTFAKFDVMLPAPFLTFAAIGFPQRLRIAIMHVGAPAGGMNAASRTIARLCLNRGHTPLAIRNGVPGLIAGDVTPLKWLEVESWMTKGGCELGTNRAQPDMDIGMCAYQLQRHNISGLVVIGGFEAFTAVVQLEKARPSYPSLCIPMIVLPATVSNNVPGTEYSVGSDTALNAIVESCDRIKQSATASRRRVFVVETQGGRCGYLATLAGLAVCSPVDVFFFSKISNQAGATSIYIPEEGLSLRRLQNDIAHLVKRYSTEPPGNSEGRIILRCENTSHTYTTEIVTNIIKEEGRGLFDARTAVLGHTQQGGTPSPLDRVRAARLAVRSVNWIEQQIWGNKVEKSRPEVHTRRGSVYLRSTSCPSV